MSISKFTIAAFSIIIATLAVARTAEAQNLRVATVPWVATDLSIPHQAYNGKATIFKAIARGGNGSYTYRWDFDGNGTYDQALQPTNNRYNLGASFTYPNQAVTTTFQAKVEVNSNGQTVVGTYPVRVFADVPLNPNLATDRQLQVMNSVAVDNALWYLHNRMTRSGNEEDPLFGAQITGNIGENGVASAAGFLWTLSLNGHFAAFPAAYIGEMPNPAENTQRFRDDPYAEDAARLINYIIGLGHLVSVAPADEANLTGFYPEISREPIFGTDDGLGYYLGATAADETIYYIGHALSALSVARLQGYVSQVGEPTKILGRRYEYVIQQVVDAAVWAQTDGGAANGGFYYTPNSGNDDLSTSLWGITALWHADEFAAASGVIVPNLVKARLVQYVNGNQNACPQGGTGGTYVTSDNANCDFTMSAAHTLVLGWVFANQYAAADTRLAFPGYNGITRGQLRTWYDSSLTFITNVWSSTIAGHHSWNMGFVVGGDFGRVDGAGCHYCMLHWQDAARAVEPEIVTFGVNNNWARQFSRYLINNQAADGGWNWQLTLGANSDNAGAAGLRAAWAVLVLSPDAIPPLAIGTSNVASAPEGTPINFTGAASDPGTGNPVYSWAFGNGATLAGQNVAYPFPDNGNFTVALTSTSIGGTSVDTFPVTITNVAPTANAGPNKVVNEGAATPFDVSFTDPGTADTFTFRWVWGDGTPNGAVKTLNKTYADNGLFNVVATVTDDDAGAGSSGLSVTVNNVPPTITSNPPANPTATEGAQFTYNLTFTDPGTADTHLCSKPISPAGSVLVGCSFRWTPNFAQAIGASTPVRMCVTDDDGGQTCQDFTISVSFLDTDNDQLPDSWEVANFGNIAATDQFGDGDADGMNNLQEFSNVTNPNVYDGPTAPLAQGPVCGSEIATQQTSLTARNATDPQPAHAASLLYRFELYRDQALTQLVIATDNVAQGAGLTTSYPVPVSLLENAHYYWRVRAKDPFTAGAWSAPVCGFFVNTANEPPNAPRINAPVFGGQANSLQPTLRVDNATDPDEDVLSYTFEVYRDQVLSQLVTSAAGRPAGVGTTAWQVNLPLTEDTTYYWRARAVDPDNVPGDWSSTGRFFVTTVNSAPEPPVIVAPQNGTLVTTLRPELIALNANDADQDVLVYDWQLATDATFAAIVASGNDAPTGGVVSSRFLLPANLVEDSRYCWRVRADDGLLTSGYVSACFLVSAVNAAPSVPVLDTPLNNATNVSVSPSYFWAPSTDAEGAPITYDLQVIDAGGAVVQAITGVSGTTTSMPVPLQFDTTYRWRARAVDSSGAFSAYSATNRFTTTFRDQDGDTLPDSWETTNFGGIVAQDQFGDPDEDGRNNRQEYAAGTDPNVYNGPGAPTSQTPICGSVVAAQPISLVAGNTVGAPGVALVYDFELFSDPGLTLQVAARDDIVQGAGATTSWQVPVNLTENRRYYWRVRAQDPFVFGAYSNPTCSFFVNTVNEAPGAPTVIAPANGTRVVVLRPTLVIGNTTDPDENPLTYQLQVYSDPGLTQLVASAVNVAPGAAGQTSWQVNVNLAEDTTYYWRARAADPSNLTGAWTPTTSLFVSAVNSAPQAPAIVAPQNATVVGVLRPELIALNAADVDQDVLVYDWQLATDNTFANVVAGANDVPTQGPISARFLLGADLAEDTSYCWRVRADDTQAVSPYSVACFLVSAVNAPPTVPVLNNPDDAAVRVSVTPTFAWAPASDAEGEAITYDVQLLDANGGLLSTVAGVAGTTSQLAAPLAYETRYQWRVRAVDRSGAASAYSAANGFTTGFEDSDNDGLPDSWEIANFGDTSQDPSGDPDGDGRNNLQEYNAGTNPTSYDGPSAPQPLAPACDSVWPSNQVNLIATNAVSPPGAPLQYEFQLFADPGLTIPVASIANLAEGAGSTEWSVPNVLDENRSYYWRVRARDSFTQGPFSVPACRFYVNSANEPPGAPRINTPAVGGQVNVLRPTLIVDNTVDPDGDALTYSFVVYADPAFANQVATVVSVGPGAGTTPWTVDVDLAEDQLFFWRARATDPDGLVGPWSGTGNFFVTTTNAPPGAPTILLPLPDSVVPTLRPELAIVNGEDDDHDVLVYDWQLATDATFTNVVAFGIDVPTQSQVSTRFLLTADLTEDTRYCWRARSDDGQATSPYATACFVVSANNAPPTVPVLNNPSNNSTVAGLNPVFSWAPSSDVEGESITYNVEVLSAAGVVVQSMIGVSGTATLMPLPLAAETSYRWRARAVDRSGGQSAFSATNTFGTGFLDADNDGLPDSWEIANFGNITAQDQFGDPDSDGRPNLHEYLGNTNPNQYNGPSAPTPQTPVCGSELAALQVRLVAGNAAGAQLRYTFELYRDQGLSIPVASTANIAQGVGTTSWLVPNPLTENTHYYWRVKARDAFTFGPYSSPACGFFVNTVNEAPGTPRINTPAPGGQVNLLRPRLVIDNATDPDEDTLTYTFEVFREPALLTMVASQSGVAAGATTTTWQLNADLQEDRSYYWRARATDPDNLAGGWSATGEFFVSTTNSPPEVPTLSAPLDGAVVPVLRPELIILDAADVDRDVLVYDWQLATDNTFANVIAGANDQRQRVFGLTMNLTEDTRYCWRARSDDGQATSAYATACFLVSAENAAPSVPTPNNPADDSKVTTFTPAFSWMVATDPEGEPITYEVEVMDKDGMVVASAAGVAGNVTAMAQELDNNEKYSWRVRAVDRSGGRSEFSASQDFTVEVLTSDATVNVGGTGCQAGRRPSAGSLLLFSLGLAFLRRRRRRRRAGDRI